MPTQYVPYDPGSIFEDDDTEAYVDADGDVMMATSEEEEIDQLIIAIDFGTTFSSVAYTCFKKGIRSGQLNIDDVQCIENYPDYVPPSGVQEPRQDVPTELWYDTTIKTTKRRHISDIYNEVPQDNDYDQDVSSNDYSFSEDETTDQIWPGASPIQASGEARAESKPIYWGFGVQRQMKMMDIPRAETRRMSRFKLILDQSKETDTVREELAPILRELVKRKTLRQRTDIFTHYLSYLLQHTKAELQRLGKLKNNMPIEFVLCVPAKWPAKGCRVMQTAMKLAVEEAGLGSQANKSVCNLFIVSEPEAAAACILAENQNELFFDECVVILDAGGGTIDAVTYKCTKEAPLRLSAEVVEPDSELWGASYINERFEKMITEKLENETYLVKNGKTIKSIADALTMAFENGEKRTLNTNKRSALLEPLWVDDLRAVPGTDLQQNRLHITRDEIKSVFAKSLHSARNVLKQQLEMAQAKECSIQKVILTGGFGQSPALQDYLKHFIKKQTNFGGGQISLIIPQSASTAVAKGAVLRALNKDYGPKRTIQSSYGFLLDEPYEPEIYSAHRNQRCHIDKSDGERYINSTIRWLIQKGETLPNITEVSIVSKHTFKLTATRLRCEEVVYVSDQKHESQYRQTHANNKAAELAGSIIADMTFLRTENLIHPELPSILSTYSGSQKLHWVVTFDLVMIVEGRNLRYEARWPAKTELKVGDEQKVKAQGQVCIAAAFQPGTA